MDEIIKAARETTILNITYKSAKKGVSERTVEPYEIKDGGLYAYDIAKQSIRKFTLANIISAKATETKFSPRWPIMI